MNVYDFDKTLYRHDSSTDFVRFLFRNNPALLRFLPRILGACLGHYVFHRLSKTQMKERFFSLFAALPEGAEPFVAGFWASHEKYLYDWYAGRRQPDDCVISASPRFLLEPVCRRLGVSRLIASEVDPATGRFDGENCHGAEKLRRFREEYPGEKIEKFYSDSHSDAPLAEAAEKAFLVRPQERLIPWPQEIQS